MLDKHLQHCATASSSYIPFRMAALIPQPKGRPASPRCVVCRSRTLALICGTRGLLQPRLYLAAGAFTGSVRHHEGDVQRLKRLYEVVKSTRQQMSGCMDPSAANYDPNAASDDGTCNYLFEDEVSGTKVEGVRASYLSGDAMCTKACAWQRCVLRAAALCVHCSALRS